MVYFKENYIFKVPEGVQHFTGKGVQFFPGGGGGGGKCLYRFCEFPGVGVRTSGSAHAYDRSTRFYSEPIPKDRFSHAMAHFSLLATSDTSKHD